MVCFQSQQGKDEFAIQTSKWVEYRCSKKLFSLIKECLCLHILHSNLISDSSAIQIKDFICIVDVQPARLFIKKANIFNLSTHENYWKFKDVGV